MMSLVKSLMKVPTTEPYVSRNPTPSISHTNNVQVGWIGTVALMMKTQIGLGVLSIPAVFDVLGIVPGIICLIIIAAITTWSDYMVGVFKRNHPQVYGIDDAGYLIFGRIGREIFGIAFCLCMSFSSQELLMDMY